MRFQNAVRWSTLHEMYPNAWLEPAKGSVQQNFDYCTKEGHWEEAGTRPSMNAMLEGAIYNLSAIDTMISEVGMNESVTSELQDYVDSTAIILIDALASVNNQHNLVFEVDDQIEEFDEDFVRLEMPVLKRQKTDITEMIDEDEF